MWENIWSQMQEANLQSFRFGGDWKDWQIESSIWLDEKKRTLNYARQQRARAICDLVEPGGRVLDIGAGAGQIAIAVAEKASWVTAVEPARGMISLFRQNLNQTKKCNVDLIPENWEMLDIQNDLCPYYDLTIASYSLGMTDLKKSIEKIQAVTRGKVVFYWYGKDEDTEREARAIWPLLHQWPYCPVPKSNIVINLLYEMGIKPELSVFTFTESIRYESVEDALVDYAIRYNAVTQRQLHLLRSFIEREFEKAAGGFVKTHNHTDMQIIWQV
jgi:SAM-dependent methyltransferase